MNLPLRRLKLALEKHRPPARLGADILWNMGSVAVLGLSGLVLNITVGRVYGPEILGVFNQVLSVYVILSQLAIGGFYFSVLRFVSEHAAQREIYSAIVSSALALAGLVAAGLSLVTYLGRGLIGWAVESQDVATALAYILPALWFFTLNKVLMAAVNGARQMRFYAAMQTLRYTLVMLFVLAGAVLALDGLKLPLAFCLAELSLLVCLLVHFFRRHRFIRPRDWGGWGRKHLKFSANAFLTGLMADINGRVDVLVLGVFCSDRLVGIYSFASMLAEGFFQLTVVARENVSPLLTTWAMTKQHGEIKLLLRTSWIIFTPIMGLLGLAVFGLYPSLVQLLVGRTEFLAAWYPLGILLGCIVWSSSYQIFIYLLNQASHPWPNALLFTAIAATNALLNLAFVPFIGIYGAAVGTGITYLLTGIFLKFFVAKTMRFAL